MKPYYYVHCIHYKSIVKYYTLESAHREAMRLSEQHKGYVFEILQCVGLVRIVKPQVFWMDGVNPAHLGPKS